MDALKQSLERSGAVISTAHTDALRMKQAGILSDQIGPSSFGGFDLGRNISGNRKRYGLFRGWLYSAVNALAQEAAGQPVNIGVLKKVLPREEERGQWARVKSYYLQKMTAAARTKAIHHDMEILEDHPLLDALEDPNPFQYRWQFVYSFVANLNLTGWAYVIGGETEDGKMEFYSVPTTWISPIGDEKEGRFSKFRVKNPKKPGVEGIVLGRENVAFAHLPNPSDPESALAPASSQIMAIRIDDHIQTSQERFFENGIFPSVIVTMGKAPVGEANAGFRPRLTGEQRRQIYGAIRMVMGGVSNYGNPAIIDGFIEKIERLSAVSNEMGWDKSEGAVRTRILSAFCVHPYILGEPVNVGGYAQAAKIEERFCKRVNTFLDMLGSVMSNFAAPMAEENNRLLVWWDKCEPHDPALHSRSMAEARKIGDITRNENRAFLGYPPAEEDIATKSKLLETVGGMTGAVAIFNAMGLNNMTPDAAAQLFSLFFELPIERTREIVGGSGREVSAPEAIASLQIAIEEMKKPMKVDCSGMDEAVEKALSIAG